MAVDYKDYYKILGVEKDAEHTAIRQAYRKLARQYHPDVNPGDKTAEAKFKEINEAHEVLSDPEKRKKYDEMSAYYQQYGHMPGEGFAGATGPAGRQGAAGGDNAQYYTMSEEDLDDLFGGQSPFSDFFDTFFQSSTGAGAGTGTRTRSGRTRATPGQDVESDVEVTLVEAYQGVTRTFELTEADGSTRRLEVKIPAGVDEGARIRIAAQGVQGTAGRGDLYLRVHVLSDPAYMRDGTTLRSKIEVPLAIAMLGGEVPVPTPDGRRLMLRVPPSTANGRSFRLRSQGMPRVGKADERGDLYAEATIVLPTHLNAEQRRLFADFARSLGYEQSGEKQA